MKASRSIRVAITSIGSGVGQSVIDACRLSRLPLRTFGYGANPLAFGAFDCDERAALPRIDDPAYLETVLERCRADAIDVLIPGLDAELALFARSIETFRAIGCDVIVSGPEMVRLCRDKTAMYRELRTIADIFVPGHDCAVLRGRAPSDALRFPLIAKPADGCASRGLRLLHGPADIEAVPDGYVVQELAVPAAEDPARAPFLAALGRGEVAQVGELSLQVVLGKDGRELGRFASYNRLQAGVPVEVVPVDAACAWEGVERLLPHLRAAGWRGPLNFQGRMTDTGFRVFEMNARFTGITGLRAMLGFNEVDAVIADALGVRAMHRTLSQPAGKIGLRQVANRVIPLDAGAEVADHANRIPGHARPPGKTVLVTGATGYLGRALLARIADSAGVARVFAAVRGAQHRREELAGLPSSVQVVDIDDILDGTFAFGLLDVVCHLASARPVNTPEELAVSMAVTRELVDLACRHHTSRFVFASTQSVFGSRRSPPWDESTPVAPETPYATAKWAAELQLESARRSGAIRQTLSVRLPRLAGPGAGLRTGEMPHGFVAAALQGRGIDVHGGAQTLDVLDVRDAAELLACAMLLPFDACPPVLNAGSARPVSIEQLAHLTAQIALDTRGLKVPVRARPAGPMPSFGMTNALAREHLGWQPRHDLRDTLVDTFDRLDPLRCPGGKR